MTKKAVEKENKTMLKLEGRLSIYEASDLKTRLVASLKDSDTLEIDMTGVQECDIPGLQILCFGKSTADRVGKRIILSGISPVVRDTMDKAGITENLIAHDGGTGCRD